MANHIPDSFSPNAGQSTNTGSSSFPPPHIFADGETVNFRVHKVEERSNYTRTFNKGTDSELVVPNCEMWSFQIVLSDPTDSGLSNMTFLDIIKDGRAWNVQSVKGSLWIQNKFINMCTGFGLRKSKEQLNLNPNWFTDTSFFTMATGQCKVEKDQYNGKYKNNITWFIDKPEEAAPVAHMNTLVDNGVDIVTFNDPAAVEVNPIDDLPF